eukprot:Pgem_evm1s5976
MFFNRPLTLINRKKVNLPFINHNFKSSLAKTNNSLPCMFYSTVKNNCAKKPFNLVDVLDDKLKSKDEKLSNINFQKLSKEVLHLFTNHFYSDGHLCTTVALSK